MYKASSLLQNLNPRSRQPHDRPQCDSESELASQIPFQTQYVSNEISSQVLSTAVGPSKIKEEAAPSLLDVLRIEQRLEGEGDLAVQPLDDGPSDCEPEDLSKSITRQHGVTDQVAERELGLLLQDAAIDVSIPNEPSSSLESLQCRPAVSALVSVTSTIPTHTNQTQEQGRGQEMLPFCLLDMIRDIRAGIASYAISHSFRQFRHISIDQKNALDGNASWYPQLDGQASRVERTPIDVLRRFETLANCAATTAKTNDESLLRSDLVETLSVIGLIARADAASQLAQEPDQDEDNETVYASQWTASPARGPQLPPDSSPLEEPPTLHPSHLVDDPAPVCATEAPTTSAIFGHNEAQSPTKTDDEGPADMTSNQDETSKIQQDGVVKMSRIVKIKSDTDHDRGEKQTVIHVEDTPCPRRNIAKNGGQDGTSATTLQSPFVPATFPPRRSNADQNTAHSNETPDRGVEDSSSAEPVVATFDGRNSIVDVEAQLESMNPEHSLTHPVSQEVRRRTPPQDDDHGRPVSREPRINTPKEGRDASTRIVSIQEQVVPVDDLEATHLKEVKSRRYHDDAYEQVDQDRKTYRRKFYQDIARSRTPNTAEPEAHPVMHPEPVYVTSTDNHVVSIPEPVPQNVSLGGIAKQGKEIEQQAIHGQIAKNRALDLMDEPPLSPPVRPGDKLETSKLCWTDGASASKALSHWHETKRKHSDFADDQAGSEPSPSEPRVSKIHRSESYRQSATRSISNMCSDRGPGLSNVYERFSRNYPAYKGNLKYFTAAVSLLQQLRDDGRELHPSLWDDFIFRRHQDYREFLQRCMEGDENAIPYEAFYHERITKPMCMSGVVTPQIIRTLGSQQHAVRTPRTNQAVQDDALMAEAAEIPVSGGWATSDRDTTVLLAPQPVSMPKTTERIVNETKNVPALSSQLSKLSETSAERVSKWLERAPGASSPELGPTTDKCRGGQNVPQKKARKSLPATFAQSPNRPSQLPPAVPFTVPRLSSSSSKLHSSRAEQTSSTNPLLPPAPTKNRHPPATPNTTFSTHVPPPLGIGQSQNHNVSSAATPTTAASNLRPTKSPGLQPQRTEAVTTPPVKSSKYTLSASAYTKYLEATSSLSSEKQRLQERLPVDIFRWG